jgi:hypothetical protein
MGKEAESACKPGSVRLAARQSFLSARRHRLAPATYPGTTRAALSFPYSVLLRVGFTVPRDVVPARGALLPHRFTLTCALAGHRRFAFCCTGRQLALPRRYLAPCPVEPGLSSMRLRATRLSGRLRRALYPFGHRPVMAKKRQSLRNSAKWRITATRLSTDYQTSYKAFRDAPVMAAASFAALAAGNSSRNNANTRRPSASRSSTSSPRPAIRITNSPRC